MDKEDGENHGGRQEERETPDDATEEEDVLEAKSGRGHAAPEERNLSDTTSDVDIGDGEKPAVSNSSKIQN